MQHACRYVSLVQAGKLFLCVSGKRGVRVSFEDPGKKFLGLILLGKPLIHDPGVIEDLCRMPVIRILLEQPLKPPKRSFV